VNCLEVVFYIAFHHVQLRYLFLAADKKDKRCQHLPPVDEDFKMISFRDQILVFFLFFSNCKV
jgi:hypothetical protein